MSFFKRKAKSKEPERVTDAKVNKAPPSPQSPSQGLRNHHAIQEPAGPSHVAINAISANMDSFARGRTAILKKQPSHMEAAHFGDLGHSSVNYQQEDRSRLSKTVEHSETFRATSWSRVRAHSLNSVQQSSLAEPVPASPGRPDLPQLGLHTADVLSRESSNEGLAKPPSRQTPSRTGTPCKLQPNSTLQDLSELMKSIEKEAVTIFTRYISPDAVRPIPITEPIRNDIVAKICGEDGMSSSSWSNSTLVISCGAIISVNTRFEVLTSGSVFLADILFCESALFYFSEYMEKEEAMNVMQFWLAADNFQNQLAAKKGQYDGQEAQNDAMILYDKYFSLQATNPLGFGDSVRMEIESNICREGGPLPDCFTTPLRQAWTTMEKVYMPGFLSSNLYYKYLSDLINSVRADEFVNVNTPGQGGPADNERSSSNASEGSQSQGAKRAAIKILKNFDEAITVDVASLDPESLYQRPYAGRMTFGKVNEMGQFIREAEPEPDVKKSKGSIFSQAMKKWVQGNSDEAQEEMAWQIAKMIVNDVVHQSGHDSPGKSTKVRILNRYDPAEEPKAITPCHLDTGPDQ
ncbi:hypothetical protein KUCAC02_003566 [Chaenocephalus aceratus]|uniref:Uncharacterized protein n=1 Tax=Chaenocephalus aceratus TaxID=36190 RepID=A0ACB9WL13_CHAAC|nr:hypothetical protein KUCAC02_003566 [Chaenocephalus aceratus]